ncbi:MAG TPA: 50S ribosomal protein L25 [Candidatus Tyrphobacter sp.]
MLKLSVERRARLGTTGAQALRAAGKVPVVLYGHGSEPETLAVEARSFEELLHRGGRTGMITLEDGGKTKDTALVREIQRDPVSRKVIHADLLRVSAHEQVRARVRVIAVGNPRGVREFGGVLDLLVHELEVEGSADALPPQLDVDVTDLGIHEHVIASEVPLPAGFTLLTPGDTVVAALEPSKTAHQLEEAAAPTVEEAPQPEVIGETPPETTE